jgi:hypothetical protein
MGVDGKGRRALFNFCAMRLRLKRIGVRSQNAYR